MGTTRWINETGAGHMLHAMPVIGLAATRPNPRIKRLSDLLASIGAPAHRFGILGARESLGDLRKIVEQFARLDLGGRNDQPLNTVIGQNILATGLARFHVIGEAEEEFDRLIGRQRNLMQTPGADAIGSVLILLDLLVRHTDHFAELLLAHLGDPTRKTHPLADETVDICGATCCHFRIIFWLRVVLYT